MNDALIGIAHRKAADPELTRVLGHRVDLSSGDLLRRGIVRGDVVIHRGERELGPAQWPFREAEPLECLRARDLMDEMKVDVEQIGLAFGPADDVPLPDLLRERAAHPLEYRLRGAIEGAPQSSHAFVDALGGRRAVREAERGGVIAGDPERVTGDERDALFERGREE